MLLGFITVHLIVNEFLVKSVAPVRFGAVTGGTMTYKMSNSYILQIHTHTTKCNAYQNIAH